MANVKVSEKLEVTETVHYIKKMEKLNINDVPDSNSPCNIINCLNDFCLQLIFRELRITDFQNVANVCTRFQENARMCFPAKFKTFFIDDYEFISDYGLAVYRVKNFLRIFGDLIESILWNYPSAPKFFYASTQNEFFGALGLRVPDDDTKRIADFDNLREKLLTTIVEYCGKTLIDIKIAGEHPVNLALLSQLKALTHLELYDIMTVGIGTFPELICFKVAHLRSNKDVTNWFCQTFPKLECAEFYYMHQLTNDTIIEFQACNPQLQILLVSGSHIDTACFRDIGIRSPNLNGLDLRLTVNRMREKPNQSYEDILDLKGLKKLNYFRLPDDINFANAMINTFCKNNIPIEHLYTQDLYPNVDLSKLKTLKQLTIGMVLYCQLIKQIEKLPKLEKLHVLSLDDYTHQRTGAIQNILEMGKNLKEFLIKIYNFGRYFTKTDYDAILSLVKGRVKATIYFGQNTLIQVDEEMLIANREWLNITSD